MRADTRVFNKSKNGKFRSKHCPYGTEADRAVPLTAAQYAKANRCLCSTCWAIRPEYYWVETYVWEGEQIG